MVTSATPNSATLRAWYVVKGFVDTVDLCICGTVDHAIEVIHETLGRYPGDESHWHSPGQDRQAVFAAYVLDSWDLLSHGGSIDAGAFRTEEGEALYRAMQSLVEAGEELLPDVMELGDAWDPPGEDVPWWRRAEAGI
jgi:hypothetical protein